MYIGATNKNEMMKYNKYILCTENRNTLLKPPMLCATDTGEWYESESYFWSLGIRAHILHAISDALISGAVFVSIKKMNSM